MARPLLSRIRPACWLVALLGMAGQALAGGVAIPPPAGDVMVRNSLNKMNHAPVAPAQVHKDLLDNLRDRDFGAALGRLEYLLALRPADPDLLVLRGCVYAENGHPRVAESIFRTVVRLSPAHPWARLNLAESLLAQKKYAEAEATLGLLTLIRPESEVVRFKLIIARLQQKNFTGANREVDALRDGSKTAAWHYASAAVAFARGDKAAGLEWLDKADDLFSPQQTAYFSKALSEAGWTAPAKR